jgi:hypothetical protein
VWNYCTPIVSQSRVYLGWPFARRQQKKISFELVLLG